MVVMISEIGKQHHRVYYKGMQAAPQFGRCSAQLFLTSSTDEASGYISAVQYQRNYLSSSDFHMWMTVISSRVGRIQKKLIESWGSLTEVTGGALRPDKSWWYLVEYVWKQGKWVASDAGQDLNLQATGRNGRVENLKYLGASESAEMMEVCGCRLVETKPK